VTPIYYVVSMPVNNPQNYLILRILAVYECDMEDIGQIWRTYVEPVTVSFGSVYTHIYAREPNNPFRDYKFRAIERDTGKFNWQRERSE
jgi:hypothetical protein